MMIKLHNILTEITFGSVQPYVTQFIWTETRRGIMETQRISADGFAVTFIMVATDANEWSFAFTVPSTNPQDAYTMNQAKSAAAGQINYLRLMRTAGEALLDFCAQKSPAAVSIEGTDTNSQKEHQKTRLYWMFLQANAARFATAGYRITKRQAYGDDVVWITRMSRADATGVNT